MALSNKTPEYNQEDPLWGLNEQGNISRQKSEQKHKFQVNSGAKKNRLGEQGGY